VSDVAAQKWHLGAEIILALGPGCRDLLHCHTNTFAKFELSQVPTSSFTLKVLLSIRHYGKQVVNPRSKSLIIILLGTYGFKTLCSHPNMGLFHNCETLHFAKIRCQHVSSTHYCHTHRKPFLLICNNTAPPGASTN